MVEDPEPTVNISGGPDGGGRTIRFDRQEPETRAAAVVARLGERYWQKAYGGQDAVYCLVRTVLSQNTSDVASQPAFDALVERFGGSTDLLDELRQVDPNLLAEIIRPAGLYNQKASVLVKSATELTDEFGSSEAFDSFVKTETADRVRDRLLAIDGVGPKTADCVLLFAGGREGVFPVDTHVHRVARRIGLAPPTADHELVREHLERAVPAAHCGFGHTATIQFGREYCTARSPVCLTDESACPVADLCDQFGVDRDSGTVVDPAETVE